jgi:hypothetical protein
MMEKFEIIGWVALWLTSSYVAYEIGKLHGMIAEIKKGKR